MFEKFSIPAQRVVVLAQVEARELNHHHFGTEDLLLGLIREGEGIAARALESMDVSLDAVRGQVQEIVENGPQKTQGHLPFTPHAKAALELALDAAQELGHDYIDTEHLLLGLIRTGEGVAIEVLIKLGTAPSALRQRIIQLLSGYHDEESDKS